MENNNNPLEYQLSLEKEIFDQSGIKLIECGQCNCSLLHKLNTKTTCFDCGFING